MRGHISLLSLIHICVQFHPEVKHTEYGQQLLTNFAKNICGCSCNWQAADQIEQLVLEIRQKVGENKRIVGALSGGVDSSVAATLAARAVGCLLYTSRVYVGDKYEDGTTLTLYTYDAEKDEFVKVEENLTVEGGYVSFETETGETYLLSSDKLVPTTILGLVPYGGTFMEYRCV